MLLQPWGQVTSRVDPTTQICKSTFDVGSQVDEDLLFIVAPGRQLGDLSPPLEGGGEKGLPNEDKRHPGIIGLEEWTGRRQVSREGDGTIGTDLQFVTVEKMMHQKVSRGFN